MITSSSKHLFYQLLSHQWKSFVRGQNKGQGIAVRLIQAFFLLYVLVSALLLGLYMEKLVQQYAGSKSNTSVFLGFILLYFLIDLIARYIFQELPSFIFKPYLLQNISRRKLGLFFTLRSLFTIFNVLPWLLFIPFVLNAIAPAHNGEDTFFFVLDIAGLCIGNHFLALYVKHQSISNRGTILFLVLLGALFVLDWLGIFSLRQLASMLLTGMLEKPWLLIVFIVWAVVHSGIYFKRLRQCFYLEDSAKGKSGIRTFLQFSNSSLLSDLMMIELKMILRNKRPRSLFILSFIFLLYGFIVFKPEVFSNAIGIPVVAAILIVGMFSINYGQFFFAWQSAYFDGIMISNISFKSLVKARFRLIAMVCTVTFIASLFYAIIDVKVIGLLVPAYFFCIGIMPVIACWLACFNYKFLDISGSSSFNFQGIGAMQWIYSLIVFMVAFVLYLPFIAIHNVEVRLLAVGFIGLVSFIVQDWWIKILYKQFLKNKYKILKGFKER
ncbi:MAG: DUF5687 family protein [Chitinophagaceae bacterium]